MRRIALIGSVLAVALVAQATGAGSAGPATVLKADTLAGVTGPYVGTAIPPNPIRGVSGGGLPWQIDRSKVVLEAGGRLTIKVEGLVLLDDAPVPEALRGTNPIANFRGLVSCQSIDGTTATTPTVTTDLFPATPAGDSKIEATVDLPSPCFAPIVFVTSPGGAWFAVTGL
jgi:hypothetical protein